MPRTAIDLDAYCARIGYAGPRVPTREVLVELQRRHMQAIPFENLDVLLKRPIRLDPDSLQRKLVAGRRGGYCFESNGLFMHALRAMGFRTTALAARVLYERPEFPLPPRSHMLQRVEFDGGAVFADVAFGGFTPGGLLRDQPTIAQPTPRETCRLIPVGDELDLQAQLGEAWRTLYRIAPHPHLPVDYEQANWHVSTHPDSYFVSNLIAALPGEGRRYTLFNTEFRTRYPDGRLETERIAGAGRLIEILEGRFGLALTPADRDALSAAFAAMASLQSCPV
jgi:N-hydroxyarylamine O-acetyltransferase